jgi:hypothetical protein
MPAPSSHLSDFVFALLATRVYTGRLGQLPVMA